MNKADWSEAPSDATHHVKHSVYDQFMKDVTDATYKFWDKGEWVRGCNIELARHATPRPVETDLTKLDTPFGELSFVTQLRLVEHVLDGGSVAICSVDGKYCNLIGFGDISFQLSRKYRAIPKLDKYEPTDRELEIAELYNKLRDLEAEIDALT